jgi:hypothetical protein
MRKIQLVELSLAGAALFWVTSLAIALLPFSAQFRAAASYSYSDVLWGAFPAGFLIALFVSVCLHLYSAKVPSGSPVAMSVLLSLAALCAIEIPATLLHGGDELYYLSIGTLLSVPRFLVLGASLGYVYLRSGEVEHPWGQFYPFRSHRYRGVGKGDA